MSYDQLYQKYLSGDSAAFDELIIRFADDPLSHCNSTIFGYHFARKTLDCLNHIMLLGGGQDVRGFQRVAVLLREWSRAATWIFFFAIIRQIVPTVIYGFIWMLGKPTKTILITAQTHCFPIAERISLCYTSIWRDVLFSKESYAERTYRSNKKRDGR